jgi:hypothetical protein
MLPFTPQSRGRDCFIILMDTIWCPVSGYDMSSQGDEVGMYSDGHSTEG